MYFPSFASTVVVIYDSLSPTARHSHASDAPGTPQAAEGARGGAPVAPRWASGAARPQRPAPKAPALSMPPPPTPPPQRAGHGGLGTHPAALPDLALDGVRVDEARGWPRVLRPARPASAGRRRGGVGWGNTHTRWVGEHTHTLGGGTHTNANGSSDRMGWVTGRWSWGRRGGESAPRG